MCSPLKEAQEQDGNSGSSEDRSNVSRHVILREAPRTPRIGEECCQSGRRTRTRISSSALALSVFILVADGEPLAFCNSLPGELGFGTGNCCTYSLKLSNDVDRTAVIFGCHGPGLRSGEDGAAFSSFPP